MPLPLSSRTTAFVAALLAAACTRAAPSPSEAPRGAAPSTAASEVASWRPDELTLQLWVWHSFDRMRVDSGRFAVVTTQHGPPTNELVPDRVVELTDDEQAVFLAAAAHLARGSARTFSVPIHSDAGFYVVLRATAPPADFDAGTFPSGALAELQRVANAVRARLRERERASLRDASTDR